MTKLHTLLGDKTKQKDRVEAFIAQPRKFVREDFDGGYRWLILKVDWEDWASKFDIRRLSDEPYEMYGIVAPNSLMDYIRKLAAERKWEDPQILVGKVITQTEDGRRGVRSWSIEDAS